MPNDQMTRYVVAVKDGKPVTTDDLQDANFLATKNGLEKFKAEVFREKDPETVLDSYDVTAEKVDKITPQEETRQRAHKEATHKEKHPANDKASKPHNEGARVPSGTRKGSFPEPFMPPADQRTPQRDRDEVIPASKPVKTATPKKGHVVSPVPATKTE